MHQHISAPVASGSTECPNPHTLIEGPVAVELYANQIQQNLELLASAFMALQPIIEARKSDLLLAKSGEGNDAA